LYRLVRASIDPEPTRLAALCPSAVAPPALSLLACDAGSVGSLGARQRHADASEGLRKEGRIVRRRDEVPIRGRQCFGAPPRDQVVRGDRLEVVEQPWSEAAETDPVHDTLGWLENADTHL